MASAPNTTDPGGGEQRFAAPAISLPTGGGAIRGIGEKFAANLVTGTGATTVAIATSPGRSGFGPQLALAYDSGTGNGPFGLSWGLSLPSITRKTDKGLPRYRDAEESDVFILSGAEDLVPMLDTGGHRLVDATSVPGYTVERYRPRVEGDFARVERWTRRIDGDVHWRTLSRDNVLAVYGKDAESRIADPLDPRRVFSWLVCETRDDRGNAIVYEYKAEDAADVDVTQPHERCRGDAASPSRTANRYLKRVRYGNREPLLDAAGRRPVELTPKAIRDAGWLFEVVFDYGEHDLDDPRPGDGGTWLCRNDPLSSCRAGFEVRTYRLCQRALMFHHFPDEAGVGADCLVRSTDLAYRETRGVADDRRRGHPTASFLAAVTQRGYVRAETGYVAKSMPPLEFDYSQASVSSQVRELDAGSLENLPAGLAPTDQHWVDLNGEGLAGVLSDDDGSWWYKPNLGDGRLGPLERVSAVPSLANLTPGRQQLLDLDGDGRLDLVQLDREPAGFFTRSVDEEWDNFIPFAALPNVDWRSGNVQLVDLTGDGLADVLITQDEVFTWHPSLGDDGFGAAERVQQALEEEQGPRLLLADGTQTVFLADMSGDGLTDLVRFRCSEVSYWPNLGYGRFGAKVTMSNAPLVDRPEHFDPQRIRLADIDGTGVIDLLYFGGDGVRLWFNQSGNRWSAPQRLPELPHLDDHTSVQVADLLGNGTACLVWSSPLLGDAHSPVRYVDLMGGQKPHLLVGVDNNLGGETHVRYAASTKFYLADRRAGRPWTTRLPFPVHVVEQVEHIDRVSRSRFVSRFTYHHGHFDGIEREFRGFAMTEQHDTEAFEDYVAGVEDIGGSQELAPELYQPPVTTRTWFHTGAYLGGRSVLHQLTDEYYLQAQDIPDPELPPGLDDEELRECVRALKGLPLRQEVYSFDGSPEAEHPYSVTETHYGIERLQPRDAQRHGVFVPRQYETVTHHYERDPGDPRIAHGFNLELGPYGNVVKSASVVYGRRTADPALPAEVTAAQQRSYITYSETDYTPDIDRFAPVPAYRLRTAYETRSHEITGVAPAGALFTLSELTGKIAAAAPIDYEAVADGVSAQKRLLSHSRAVFRDDAGGPLPLGQWDTLALPYEDYRLAFTPGVTAAHYAGELTDADFVAAGYVHLAGDANWWAPSGRHVYPADPAAHFYLPAGLRDPLGTETTVTLDQYDLLPESTRVTQATWTEISATNDYRVLGAVAKTDPNQNRSAVEVDALGLVVASAVMGKAGAGEGDTLVDPTTRTDYELFNWIDNAEPNYARVRTREHHGAGNVRWQERYVYSNGRGGVAMVKVRAEAGEALRANPDGTVSEVDADPRWIGSGRTILNNKGNPVKTYEPFFSTTHEYEDEESLRSIGATPILYYDPLGRNLRTEYADGTLSRVEFDAWTQRRFDPNDTVLESGWYANRGSPDPVADPEPVADPARRAAWLAAKHAGTPGQVHLDSLSRPIYAVSDYGGGTTASVRTEVDLTGRNTRILDQLQREVMRKFTGMAGTPVFSQSAERGSRWTFVDVLGGLVRTWDHNGRSVRAAYDVLHRPTGTYVREPGAAEVLFDYVVYGDRHPQAVARNLRGVPHQTFDQAGLATVERADVNGNAAVAERTLARDYTGTRDWSALAAAAGYAAIQSAAGPSLAGETFTAGSTYDALSRPVELTLHGGTVIRPTYDQGGLLASLQVRIEGRGAFVEFLAEQDHDAKGQRQFARYGNGVISRYLYDPDNFRLTNLLTFKSGTDPATASLQDLHYTYDAVGNVTQVRDGAQQTHFFSNAVVTAEGRYEYDALYQLVRATGREHAVPANDAIRDDRDVDAVSEMPHLNDASAVRNYTERYEYDLLGNIRRMRHVAPVDGGWTRHYQYLRDTSPGDKTNRLAATSRPGDPAAGPYTATYDYDDYGNMTRLRMPTPGELAWNFMDQLQRVDLGGGGTAHYVYSAAGQRVRKVVERVGAPRSERIYLGPLEIYRERQGNNPHHLERRTLHISDDEGGIAQVDVKTRDDNNSDPANPLDVPLVRYVYANNLGSATLETDSAGTVISYEEYHPFGTSAYRSGKPGFGLSFKRYRFARKERDDETGLYYFGARFYAPWLGRWTSSDPAGFADGLNLYRYARNNPVTLVDPDGRQSQGGGGGDIIPHTGFTGQETLADIREFARSHNRVLDPSVTEENYRSAWIPHPTKPGGVGGHWNLPIRPMTPAELAAQLAPATVPPAAPGTNLVSAGAQGAANYRQNNVMPPGTQAQHWTKQIESRQTNMPPEVMNENMSPLQSRNALPATLLLRDPGGGGTTYSVQGGPSFGNEHTFADRYLIPREAARIQAANPGADPRAVVVESGRQARWIMEGTPGPAPGAGAGFGVAVPANQVLQRLPQQTGWQRFGESVRNAYRSAVYTISGQNRATAIGGALARGLIPGFVEAEIAAMSAPYVVASLGITNSTVVSAAAAMAAAPAATAAVAVASAAGGYIVGDVVESVVTEATGSRAGGVAAGTASGAVTGALIGAAIGSVVPVLGTGVGAAVGAVAGGIAGFIGSYW
ncbi:MAG TPA: SpvB/TcaC N-terminal domain-containing protein [Thermoleophilaceae bacterium]|nr:SpvB/TcaC N-terminal domain-containing protein [Thermoleophilaceae bacterium]